VTHHHLVTDVRCPLPLETTLSLRLRCQGTPLSFIENVRWPHTPVLPTMVYLAERPAIYYCRQAISGLSNLTSPPYHTNGRYRRSFVNSTMSSYASTNVNHTLQSTSYAFDGTTYTVWDTTVHGDSVESPELLTADLYLGHDVETGNVGGYLRAGQSQIDFQRPGQDLQTWQVEQKPVCWDLYILCGTVPQDTIKEMMQYHANHIEAGYDCTIRARGKPLENLTHAQVAHPNKVVYAEAEPWKFLGVIDPTSRAVDGRLEPGTAAT
jgi:hypothetical protein